MLRLSPPSCGSELARDAFKGSMHRFNALRTAIAHAPQAKTNRPSSKKTAQTKAKAPEYGAFLIFSSFFVTSHLKLARPLQQLDHYPVSGTLVQAGRGFPILYGLSEPTVLGALIQAGQGFPSLHPGPCAKRQPSRFGDLGTGRPGIPSFIALGDGPPAASDHPLRCRSTPLATDAPPPASATAPRHSNAPASSRPCR